MAKERLIGNDGYLILEEIGTAYVGDAVSDFDTLNGGGVGSGRGFYEIKTKASTGSFFANLEIGDFTYNDGTGVMATGDTAIPIPVTLNTINEAENADATITNFEIALSKDKIDTTTLTDDIKNYRMGKGDASGTMNGITTINKEILSDRFLVRIEQNEDGSSTTRVEQKDFPLYFVGFLQGKYDSGEVVSVIIGKAELESFSYGASDGSAQEFSTGFAPASGSKLQKINITIA